MNATIQTELHDTRDTWTQTKPISTQIVKEQHEVVTEATTRIENVHFCNVVVQMEVIPSNNWTPRQMFKPKMC